VSWIDSPHLAGVPEPESGVAFALLLLPVLLLRRELGLGGFVVRVAYLVKLRFDRQS
jgi:hypothetical protein